MEKIVQDLADRLVKNQQIIVTAESCTGGWIAQELTSIAGSSAWFDRGFVTYSNQSKQEMLGVSEATLQQYGAVSEQVVKEMAEGALLHSCAQFSVVTSGIAGPGGGSEEKPVGTVWFAWGCDGGETKTQMCCFDGDRESVRKQAVSFALEGIYRTFLLEGCNPENL